MTGVAQTFLNGFINYPGDRRIHGLRARRLANIMAGNRKAPAGSVRVRLLEGNKYYAAGREVTLLPGVFVREMPQGQLTDKERAARWREQTNPLERSEWSMLGGRSSQTSSIYFDFAVSDDETEVLIHAAVDAPGFVEDLRFEIVPLEDAVEVAQGAIDLAGEWFETNGHRRITGKRRAAAFRRAVFTAVEDAIWRRDPENRAKQERFNAGVDAGLKEAAPVIRAVLGE